MSQCCQIKFSLDSGPLMMRNSEGFPMKIRHSSFIMRLKSSAKTRVAKYQGGYKKQSVADELAMCLSPPIRKQNSEKSREPTSELLKLNVTNFSSTRRQQLSRLYSSPVKMTTSTDRKRRTMRNNSDRFMTTKQDDFSFVQSPSDICPLYVPETSKNSTSPRKVLITSRARIVVAKTKSYDEFYGDQKSEDNMKVMIRYYRDFIWKVAFSNQHLLRVVYEKPRVYIGKGNNSRLVKSTMRSRWWWASEKDQSNANFVWTQLKISSIYPAQKSGKTIHPEPKQIQMVPECKLKGDPAIQIMNPQQLSSWNVYFQVSQKFQKRITQSQGCRKPLTAQLRSLPVEKVSNHLQFSRMIGNKKALFYTMRQYYGLSQVDYQEFLPLTYHIVSGTEDQQYTSFLKAYSDNRKTGKVNMWIVKPGQLSNRGNGIKVCSDLNQIRQILKSKAVHNNGRQKTYIVQQYLSDPFLYRARKFDIRHYMLITSVGGVIKGYWYEEGYIRTTSYQYNTSQLGGLIHLTNDAVQKYSKDYGKYQKGNKLSYHDFQSYLDEKYGQNTYSLGKVLQKMKKVATDAIRASYLIIDPNRRQHNFQIFGLDFMIDSQFNPWLIECNTNPCLELSSPLLAKLIPSMLDNALRIGLDPLFPPPPNTYPVRKVPIDVNRFQLVFDQLYHGKSIEQLYKGQRSTAQFLQGIGSDDEAFQDNDESDDN